MGSLFRCSNLGAVASLIALFIQGVSVAAQTPAHGGATSPMSRSVNLKSDYVGARDSLISIIGREAGIVVAYSSRSLPPGNVRMPKGRHTVGESLDAIFGRYNVRYVQHDGGRKIVVAADSVKTCHVSGFCKDALTGEVLIGAHVMDTLLRIATATNEYGFFSLPVPSGRAAIRASFVGYTPSVRTVNLSKDTMETMRLTPRIMLTAVEVKAPEASEEEAESIGMTKFNTDEIKNMPGLMGEADLGRALQQTPGVKSGSEGFGGMSVRGGSQDQNNILLDDAPLFNANHALGFFSAFNSDAVNNAVLIKSGFPARYGGRMASVLDIKTLDGNMSHFEGNANVGLMASSLMLQGPIRKGEASFLFSARRTYFDLFSNLIQTNEDNHYSYLFYDFHVKLNWRIGLRDHLRVSYFNGIDRLTNDTNTDDTGIEYGNNEIRYLSTGDENNTKWGTHLVSLRWGHVFGSQVFSNTTAWFTKYTFSNKQKELTLLRSSNNQVGNEYRNGIKDAGAKVDVSIHPGTPVLNKVRLGAWYEYKSYEPVVSIYAPEPNDTTQTRHERSMTITSRHELHGYAETMLKVDALWASAGIHFTLVSRESGSPYLVGEPRLLAGWHPAEKVSFKVGYSLTTQFAYLMRMLTVATPSDIWLPVPHDGGPQRSSQISVEAQWQITPDISLEVEAYNKKMRRLVTYKTSSPYELMRKGDWDEMGASGSGYARGMEVFLHSKKGRISGWLGYSLSCARNRFDDINDGEEFPADNDRLHCVQIFTNVSIKKNVDVSLSWNYGTGAPLTLPTQRYSLPGSDAAYSVEPRRNALKLPAEHQLNIGATIRFGNKKAGSLISFGIYNVYARQNPMFVYWKAGKGKDGNTEYKLKKFSLIGIPCPYVKYAINF